MTKVKNNPLLQGLSGKMGETHVYKQFQGKTIMTNAPAERRSNSEKQEAAIARFLEASEYARRQMNDPASKAEYEKGITLNKNAAYRVAFTDFMKPPVVHYVKTKGYTGAIGDLITIKATDDFKVTTVKISITSGAGKVLEEGDAVRNARKWYMWNYRTTVVNESVEGTVIKVKAYDKPGNEGRGEVVLEGV